MNLDQQIDASIQKFTDKISSLTAEKEELVRQKNKILYTNKQQDNTNTTILDSLKELNQKILLQQEKKSRQKDDFAKLNDETQAIEAKISKLKALIAKYEATMNEKIVEAKKAYQNAQAERNSTRGQNEQHLDALIRENISSQKELNDEEKMINKLVLQVMEINEREQKRSSVLNNFLKQIDDPYYNKQK